MSGTSMIWRTATVATMLWGVAAGARTPVPAADAKALDPILACRSQTDGPARLACYDNAVGALQTATARHDIVVINQQDVARARRSLFGFNLPSFDFLGGARTGDAHDTPEDTNITSTIRSVHRDSDGNWIVTLDDGAVWHQTTGQLAVAPKPGEVVEIKRAALGSYFMRIGRQPGFKAKRES